MSLAAFQSLLLRLIAEPPFRDDVLDRGAAALPSDALTPLEAKRLVAIAADRGLDVNRTLHKGFRLGKLRALLPLTCRLLGPRGLAAEVSAFWAARPPASFYFIPEALDFCDHLVRRRLRSRYLGQVLAYERAALEVVRARSGPPPVVEVAFEHDPAVLLAQVAAGRRPRAVPRRPCIAVARLGADGRADWRLREGAAA